MNPATLPVPKQILLAEIYGIRKDYRTGRKEVCTYISEREQKLLFFILHAVFNDLEPGVEHELDMRTIYSALKNEYGINEQSYTWIWEGMTYLSDIRLRYVLTEGDERWTCSGHLLTAKTSVNIRRSGFLKFEFNKDLVPLLKDQSKFSRVRLHFLMRLSSRHAITLYGILEGFVNYKRTFVLELETIREWLKITSEQYKLYGDFRRYVIEPTFNQINKDPEGAGFAVAYEPVKRGRKVTAIEVTLTKTEARNRLENSIKEKKKLKAASNNSVLPTIKLNPEKLKNIAKKKGIRDDIYGLAAMYEVEWRVWLYKTGKSETIKEPEGSLVGFILNKTGPLPRHT